MPWAKEHSKKRINTCLINSHVESSVSISQYIDHTPVRLIHTDQKLIKTLIFFFFYPSLLWSTNTHHMTLIILQLVPQRHKLSEIFIDIHRAMLLQLPQLYLDLILSEIIVSVVHCLSSLVVDYSISDILRYRICNPRHHHAITSRPENRCPIIVMWSSDMQM